MSRSANNCLTWWEKYKCLFCSHIMCEEWLISAKVWIIFCMSFKDSEELPLHSNIRHFCFECFVNCFYSLFLCFGYLTRHIERIARHASLYFPTSSHTTPSATITISALSFRKGSGSKK